MTQANKLLIIKTSSLGDVVHMLPALTDALHQKPDLMIDWVVEEGFAEVPAWHPGVRQVIPVAIRRWRKQLFSAEVRNEIRRFTDTLRTEKYDYVLDSQGLLKSAVLTLLARGERYGYDRNSIREPLASVFYQQRLPIGREQHAILRNRLLTACTLDYSIENLPLEHGIANTAFPLPPIELPGNYIVAFHGTSRPDKEWPESHWQDLIRAMAREGLHTLLPWGNEREKARAERLAAHPDAHALPRCRLGELAAILQGAQGVIGMDTGLMHIAAALNQKGVALYPSTSPALTGITGNSHSENQIETLGGKETSDSQLVIQKLLRHLHP